NTASGAASRLHPRAPTLDFPNPLHESVTCPAIQAHRLERQVRSAMVESWLTRRGGLQIAAPPPPQPSSRTASSTCSACPVTRTFGQMRAIRPSRPIRQLECSTPMNLRPYRVFSFHTP